MGQAENMKSAAKIVPHCWKDSVEDAEERFRYASDEWAEAFLHRGTCMLAAGHEGPHEFTDDSKVLVRFE